MSTAVFHRPHGGRLNQSLVLVFLAVGTLVFLHQTTKTQPLLFIQGDTLYDRQTSSMSSGSARDLVDINPTGTSSLSSTNDHDDKVSAVSSLPSSSLAGASTPPPVNDEQLTKRKQGQQKHQYDFTSPRINYTLRHGRSIRGEKKLWYNCLPNDPKRVALPSAVQNSKGLFDFLPEISTDLRILMLGDSLARQFSTAIVESLVPYEFAPHAADVTSTMNETDTPVAEQAMIPVYNPPFTREIGGRAKLHMSAITRGGGFYTGYVAHDLLRRRATNKSFSPAVVQEILTDRSYHEQFAGGDLTNLTARKFDTLITRIPHSWMELDAITRESLQEHVELARELFGVDSVILMNLPFINNVKSLDDWRELQAKRILIRDFAHSWPRGKAGIASIQVMELGTFLDQVFELNAVNIGYNVSAGPEDWLMSHSLQKTKKNWGFRKKIAQVCGEMAVDGQPECLGNFFSFDGIHLCFQTLGGRIFSGAACLLECAYSPSIWSESLEASSQSLLRECEGRCNEKFLTIQPVETGILGENVVGARQ